MKKASDNQHARVVLRIFTIGIIGITAAINGMIISEAFKTSLISVVVRITGQTRNDAVKNFFRFFPIVSNIKNSSVLGYSHTEQDVAALQQQYELWQSVISTHADFRDGYVHLALLSYQLGNMTALRQHIESIRALDPNYPELQKLTMLLGELVKNSGE